MSNDYVWVSTIFKNARLNRGWNIDIFHSGKSEQEPWLFSANRYGLPVPEEHRMQKIWADEDDAPIKKLPPVFETDYAILVSEKVKPVFDGFDLGKGDLLPMKDGILQSDQVTKYGEEYFSWVIGNKKTAVLLDETKYKIKLNPRGEVWHLGSAPEMADNIVTVSQAVLDGPDQWVDPLQSSLFLSRRLGDAIVEAGLKEAFFLYRCRVI
jgi:hypothetical protein